MVHGSRLMAHASRLVAQLQEKIGAGSSRLRALTPVFFGLVPRALTHEPWAFSHEPSTINYRFIDWSTRLCIIIRISCSQKKQSFFISSFLRFFVLLLITKCPCYVSWKILIPYLRLSKTIETDFFCFGSVCPTFQKLRIVNVQSYKF